MKQICLKGIITVKNELPQKNIHHDNVRLYLKAGNLTLKPRLHIHDFLYDSPRFLMVRKIGMDRDESWQKVEIFSVTTILVRMSTILVRCL